MLISESRLVLIVFCYFVRAAMESRITALEGTIQELQARVQPVASSRITALEVTIQELQARAHPVASPTTDAQLYQVFRDSSSFRLLESCDVLPFPLIRTRSPRFFPNNCFDSTRDFTSELTQVGPFILDQLTNAGLKNFQDGQSTPTLGTRKPDLPIYFPDSPKSEFYMSAIGDFKKHQKDDKFSSEDKGHIIGFGGILVYFSVAVSFFFPFLLMSPSLIFPEELLSFHQPFRPFVPLFLITERLVQFFILSCVPSGLRFTLQESPVLLLQGNGRDVLWSLFKATPRDLSFSLPTVIFGAQAIKLSALLGVGASATVYYGTLPEEKEPVAVKVFREDKLHRLQQERDNLNRLHSNHNVEHCTRLLGVSDCATALVLSPVGLHFTFDPFPSSAPPPLLQKYLIPCKKQHLIALLDVLQSFHRSSNLVHRDIKFGNFFAENSVSESVILNDLGCAVDNNSFHPFAGTIQYASDDALSALINNQNKTWQFADDLQSLVRVSIMAMCRVEYLPTRASEARQFWSSWFSDHPIWVPCATLAANCDYNGLKNWLLNSV